MIVKGKRDLNNNKLYRRMAKYICCTVLVLLCFPSAFSLAQIPPSCDADYYDVLRARGYLEGKREMETAQRIILKPDSVLEYSCFDDHLNRAGNMAGTFSVLALATGGTPAQFNGGIGISSASLTNRLNQVVYNELVGYLSSFSHTYGGGTISLPPSAICNPMYTVWAASKCKNFDPSWWVRFEDLSTIDIRNVPMPCGNPGARSGKISAALGAAFPAPAPVSVSGSMDSYTGYVDWIMDCAASAPIPTGLQFTRHDGTSVDDAVCVVPGCRYDGTACN